jgi:hypothetical protein
LGASAAFGGLCTQLSARSVILDFNRKSLDHIESPSSHHVGESAEAQAGTSFFGRPNICYLSSLFRLLKMFQFDSHMLNKYA